MIYLFPPRLFVQKFKSQSCPYSSLTRHRQILNGNYNNGTQNFPFRICPNSTLMTPDNINANIWLFPEISLNTCKLVGGF